MWDTGPHPLPDGVSACWVDLERLWHLSALIYIHPLLLSPRRILSSPLLLTHPVHPKTRLPLVPRPGVDRITRGRTRSESAEPLRNKSRLGESTRCPVSFLSCAALDSLPSRNPWFRLFLRCDVCAGSAKVCPIASCSEDSPELIGAFSLRVPVVNMFKSTHRQNAT